MHHWCPAELCQEEHAAPKQTIEENVKQSFKQKDDEEGDFVQYKSQLPCVMVCRLGVEQLGRAFHR